MPSLPPPTRRPHRYVTTSCHTSSGVECTALCFCPVSQCATYQAMHEYVLKGSHSYVGLVRVVIASFIFLSLSIGEEELNVDALVSTEVFLFLLSSIRYFGCFELLMRGTSESD